MAYLRKNYQGTLAQIDNLISHGEIAFNLLYAVLIPRTVLITRCSKTGEPRALKLLFAALETSARGPYYALSCHSVEGASADDDDNDDDDAGIERDSAAPSFGMDQSWLSIPEFKGTRKINSLSAFPIQYHPDPEAIRDKLVRRGRKWAVLNGIHHVAYRGLGIDDMNNKYSVSRSCSVNLVLLNLTDIGGYR